MTDLQAARLALADFSTKFWHGAATAQIDQAEAAIAGLAERCLRAEVVGTHRSKSIELPVVRITTAAGAFTRGCRRRIDRSSMKNQPAPLRQARTGDTCQG